MQKRNPTKQFKHSKYKMMGFMMNKTQDSGHPEWGGCLGEGEESKKEVSLHQSSKTMGRMGQAKMGFRACGEERKSMNSKRRESGYGKHGGPIWLKSVQEGTHGQQVERTGKDESRGRMVKQTWMPSLPLSRQEGAPAGSYTGKGRVPEENYFSCR